uniref:Uncharacterized protein n=1 Tax=Aegilops tauschii subsp. strangulata TaxID=200361 RepID=A0A453H0X9_AEGTS
SIVRPTQVQSTNAEIRRCRRRLILPNSFSPFFRRPEKRGQTKSTSGEEEIRMRLSFPLVAGAVVAGVISGNVIFGPPLQKYWAEKQQQEQAAKEGQNGST